MVSGGLLLEFSSSTLSTLSTFPSLLFSYFFLLSKKFSEIINIYLDFIDTVVLCCPTLWEEKDQDKFYFVCFAWYDRQVRRARRTDNSITIALASTWQPPKSPVSALSKSSEENGSNTSNRDCWPLFVHYLSARQITRRHGKNKISANISRLIRCNQGGEGEGSDSQLEVYVFLVKLQLHFVGIKVSEYWGENRK